MNDYDELRALAIQMSAYFRNHRLQTGECMAWLSMKNLLGTGDDFDADRLWLQAYLKAHPESKAHSGPIHVSEAQS